MAEKSTALATIGEMHKRVANELEASRSRLLAVIPAATGLTPSRAIGVVLDALSRAPDLLQCTTRSLVRSVIHASELGLELNTPIGEAYIVPFYNSKRRIKEASMMPGYRGYVKLVRSNPRVESMQGVLVRERDEFRVDRGANKLHHVEALGTIRERGRVIYAYSIVRYVSGGIEFEVMDRDELDKIKTAAIERVKKGGGFSPWQTHEDEMYRKCPIRKHAKTLELTAGWTNNDGVPLAKRVRELDDLEAMRRGELGVLREAFVSGRAEELKAQIRAQDEPVNVIDADFDEEPPK